MYLARIIRDVNNITKFNQWRDTSTVFKGCRNIATKITADLSNLISRYFIFQFLRSFWKSCPLIGKCLAKCIVYKAEVNTTDERKLYHGKSDGEFKTSFNKHTSSFKHKRYSTDTELCKYIWKLSSKLN